jgi:hypothetical protein
MDSSARFVRITGGRHREALVRIAFTAALMLCGATASASENGGFSNFPVGAQTVGAAFLPPPGATEFYGYGLYYSAQRIRDGSGDKIPGVAVTLFAQAPRIVHTWSTTFGGVAISSGLVGETAYVKVKAGGQNDDTFGATLIGIEPFDLTASWGNIHVLSGTHFYIAVGGYDRNALANSTTNYDALAQQFALTWMPTPRWDLSINPNVEFNLRNHATGYRSGDQFGLTWGLSYRPFEADPKLQLGLNGFHIHQLGDDRSHGTPVPGGNRLRKSAVGPQLTYSFTPAAVLLVKWQHEFDVRNGPQGELFWVEFALPVAF